MVRMEQAHLTFLALNSSERCARSCFSSALLLMLPVVWAVSVINDSCSKPYH